MKLTGFTLFRVSRGWQMSTRIDGEDGWSVQIISDADAVDLLRKITASADRVIAPETPKPAPPAGTLNLRPSGRRVMLE